MAKECPKLTVKEHALITDMEGSYIWYPKEYMRVVSFGQDEKSVVDCWCENAKKIGVKNCKVRRTPTEWLGEVRGSDAVLLAKKHLDSSGIITEKHKKSAKNLIEHPPRPYKRKKRVFKI